MDFLATDKILCHGRKNFVQDNLGFVLDKNYFVRAEGRGISFKKIIPKIFDGIFRDFFRKVPHMMIGIGLVILDLNF